jgi:aminopeptidase N
MLISKKCVKLYTDSLYIGSCVVRMCADMLGIETFKRGLTRYLSKK